MCLLCFAGGLNETMLCNGFVVVVVVVVAVVVMSPLVDTTCRVLVPFLAWEGSPAHAATSWVILTTHQTQELKGMKSSRRVYIY